MIDILSQHLNEYNEDFPTLPTSGFPYFLCLSLRFLYWTDSEQLTKSRTKTIRALDEMIRTDQLTLDQLRAGTTFGLVAGRALFVFKQYLLELQEKQNNNKDKSKDKEKRYLKDALRIHLAYVDIFLNCVKTN